MNEEISNFDPFPPSPEVRAGALHLVGFPFDGTACYRKGTREGPAAIRQASCNIETYSPYFDADTVDVVGVDLGDLQLDESRDAEAVWASGNREFRRLAAERDLRRERVRFLVLGGEHSISYQPIRSCLEAYPDLLLVQLDAHADLRDGYEGYHYSHASILRRILDHFGPSHRLMQQGIRSGTREEFGWMRSHQTLLSSVHEICRALEGERANRPIYLTLDVDYFDPSGMPGTGTPEPGGATFRDFLEVLQVLSRRRLVGADVVELAPGLDPSGISEVMATECVRELTLAMHRSLSVADWKD